jgi:hypothetical protein
VSWRGGAWTSSPATFAISSRRVDFCVSFRFPHDQLETAADGIIAGIVVDQFLGELREPRTSRLGIGSNFWSTLFPMRRMPSLGGSHGEPP